MKEFDDLVNIVARLRGPGGCPWDKKQKIPNYRSYLLEEMYECVDSLDEKDADKAKEELGDLLLLIVSLAHIFKEKKEFDIRDSLNSINRKLIQRHPHVFSDKKINSSQEVITQWYELKFDERKKDRHFSHIPRNMPSLMKAYKAVKEAVKRRKFKFSEREARRDFKRKAALFCERPTKKGLKEVLFSLVKVCSVYSYEPEVCFLDFLKRKFKI